MCTRVNDLFAVHEFIFLPMCVMYVPVNQIEIQLLSLDENTYKYIHSQCNAASFGHRRVRGLQVRVV